MEYVDLRLLSADHVGYIERARLSLRPATGYPQQSASTAVLSDDQDLAELLGQARVVAERILRNNAVVAECKARSLSEYDLNLSLEGNVRYQGPSFGLTLLLGVLGLALDCPLRRGHIFSAGLPNPHAGENATEVALQEIHDAPQKIKAAINGGFDRIFLACGEVDILSHQSGYWSTTTERACLPVPLPFDHPTPVSALLGLGLDLAPLCDRLDDDSVAATLAVWCLQGLERTSLPDVLQPWMARALARARGRGTLAAPVSPNGKPIDEFLWSIGPSALNATVDEPRRLDIVKSLISCDPDLPVVPAADSERSDITRWLETLAGSPADVERVIAIVSALRLTPHDHCAYAPECQRIILRAADAQARLMVDHSAELGAATRQLKALVHGMAALCQGAIELWPELAPRLKQVFDHRISSDTPGDAVKQGLVALSQHCSLLDLDERFRAALDSTQGDQLSIVFQAPEAAADSEPGLVRLNDLESALCIASVEVRISSPVLLLEEPRHVSPFCRRAGMRDVDRALAYLPVDDAARVCQEFGNRDKFNSIGFRFSDHEEAVTTLWPPTTFPPAIDSMHLLAAVEKFADRLKPRTVLDAGCGTGLLGLAAGALWPSVERIAFVDVNAHTVHAAELNARRRYGSDGPRCEFRASNLAVEKPSAFDLVLCNPPYLPSRPIPQDGIELATNGTALLEAMLSRHARSSAHTFLVCSALAWPEAVRAASMGGTRHAAVVRRAFAPFRLPWLEPSEERPNFNGKRRHYEEVLMPRGLIDLNARYDPHEYLDQFPVGPKWAEIKIEDQAPSSSVEEAARNLPSGCRGFRFWHEVRVLHLEGEDAPQ